MNDRLPQMLLRNQNDDFIMSPEAQQFLSKNVIIVRMRGLPYECTYKQVIDFFKNGDQSCEIHGGEDGILFVKKPDGRSTGDAFVQFLYESEATKALSKHKELIGPRYIELFKTTPGEVEQVLRKSQETKPRITSIQLPPPVIPQHIRSSGSRRDCVRLRGLPYEAQVEHIINFLGEHAKNIMYEGVHMIYSTNGKPNGEAFIRMDSEAAANQVANTCNKMHMNCGKKSRYIEVFQCSEVEVIGYNGASHVSPTKANSVLNPGTTLYGPPPLPIYAVYVPSLQLLDSRFYSQPQISLQTPKWCPEYNEIYYQPFNYQSIPQGLSHAAV